MSIQPKWCEKILNGDKTVEIRKTCPKELPFKVYIYQTKKHWIYKILKWLGLWQGKVVGEFIVNRIDELKQLNCGIAYNVDKKYSNNTLELCKSSCLTYNEITEYLNKKDGYVWHISDLKIYDKPKSLSEFKVLCKNYANSCDEYCGFFKNGLCECGYKLLTRAPQSWQYVEKVEEE